MKTAISIPDDMLRSVTLAAKRMRVSRSEFFARAAKSYLKHVDKSTLTERINAALDKIGPAPLDPVQVLAREEDDAQGRMAMSRGEIYWVDFGEPRGSEPGYLRPVLIVQADSFNDSKIATTVGISLTSNLKYRALPGCIFLSAEESGLPKDSVINLTQIQTVNKDEIGELIGQIPDELMAAVDFALMEVLGLS